MKALEGVEIQGYGPLHDVRFGLSPERNVLVGPSGSGKSTVLEAIACASFFAGDWERPGKAPWEAAPSWKLTLRVRVEDATILYSYADARWTARSLTGILDVLDGQVDAGMKLMRQICLLAPTPEWMLSDKSRRERPNSYGMDLLARLSSRPDLWDEIVQSMHPIAGWTSFRESEGKLSYTEVGSTARLPLDAMSSGARMNLWLLSLALDPPTGAVVLIDDADLHLNASEAQFRGQLLRTLSTSCQVIVSAHSGALISEFVDSSDDVLVVSRQPRAGTQVRKLHSCPHALDAVQELGLGEASAAYGSRDAVTP